MASLSHAQEISDIAKNLADPKISESARAEILLSMTTMVREVAQLKDQLAVKATELSKAKEEADAEVQEVEKRYQHALKKHNEQRGMANDLRHELTEAQNELAPIKESLSHQRERVSYLKKEVVRLKSVNEKLHQDHDTVAILQRRQHAGIEAEIKEQLDAKKAELIEVGKKNEHLRCVGAALTSALEESQKSFTDIQSENARLHKENLNPLHENADKGELAAHFSSETQRLTDELAVAQKHLDESNVRETEHRDEIARHEKYAADLIETYQTKQRSLREKIAAVETELADVKTQLETQTAAATGFRNEAIQLEATNADIREKAKSNTAKLLIAQQKVESHDQLLAAIETSRDAWMDDARTLLAHIVRHRKPYEYEMDWLWNLPIREDILASEDTETDE